MNENIDLRFSVGLAGHSFNDIYFDLNKGIMENGKLVKSRNGDTKEFLNFKTILKNPVNRCVGGNYRNVNIFFLLAEALWIFNGRKDVGFLETFNSNLSQFSDNGKVYHAPYGFRMRHWGVRSEDRPTSENLHAFQGVDQISDIVKILSNDSESRQAVVSIWNVDLDLGVDSKDIPCNDLIMFKIRDKKLYTTIQNRSNDLHWGLCTNIFQFSFLSEILAKCLGVGVGDQIHNSQSLHIYVDSDISKKMLDKNTLDLYQISESKEIDFNFFSSTPMIRLREVDHYVSNIIRNIEAIRRDSNYDDSLFFKELGVFSKYLKDVYTLLKIYVEYKETKNIKTALDKITHISNQRLDIVLLALNFFNVRSGNFSEIDFL